MTKSPYTCKACSMINILKGSWRHGKRLTIGNTFHNAESDIFFFPSFYCSDTLQDRFHKIIKARVILLCKHAIW